jgi:glutathione synthase/RimK-type ligase-like ATP-grasp enzyme
MLKKKTIQKSSLNSRSAGVITKFRPRLRTKNYSTDGLKDMLRECLFPVRSIIRMGSTTETSEIVTPGKRVIELNTVESIETSRNKLLMQEAFNKSKLPISRANYFEIKKMPDFKSLKFPVLAKKIVGQGGEGMKKFDTIEEFKKFLSSSTSGYYVEEYFNGAREYRLHVTEDGCFLAWRKLRKEDAKERWYFNSNNCIWAGESNESFDKPVNWNEIVEHSVNALSAVGLSIGAIDVRVESSVDTKGNKRKTCKFIILETNSAPALGEVGSKAYFDEIKRLINKKLNN